MPVPWPEGLVAEAIVPVLTTAVAAGVLGGFIGGSFAAAGEGRRLRPPALAPAVAALFAIAVAAGLNVGDQAPGGWSARVSLDPVNGGPERTANATIRIDPPQAADDAYWLNAISWQGGGKLVLDDLVRRRRASRQTTEPLPVYGTWKTLIRLHRDNVRRGGADLHARGHGDPGEGGPGEGELRPAVRRRDTDPPARAEVETSPDTWSGSPMGRRGDRLRPDALLGWVLDRVARDPTGATRRARARAARRTGAREVTA